MTQAPTVNRRQLGAELRRLRDAKGLKADDVAARLGTSTTRLSRMESGKGRVSIKPADVISLCELYEVTDERQVQRLIEMLNTSQQPGWWDQYREVLPSGLEMLFGLETDALAIRAWEPLIVHGMLQTPEYARAILSSSPDTRPRDIDDMVTVRMKRKKLLADRGPRDPLKLWAILDEQAVRRPVGGPAVMAAQIGHLIESAALPNITIQVVRTAKGAHVGLGGAFSVLEFETDPSVVYVDSPAGNLYLEKAADVRRFGASLDMLTALALDPDESLALLHDAAKENTT